MGAKKEAELIRGIIREKIAKENFCYPHELKLRIVKCAKELMASGLTKTEAAQRLGVSRSTLSSWSKIRASSSQQNFLPVVVHEISQETNNPITVYGPRGLRAEGLKLPHLVELWKNLL